MVKKKCIKFGHVGILEASQLFAGFCPTSLMPKQAFRPYPPVSPAVGVEKLRLWHFPPGAVPGLKRWRNGNIWPMTVAFLSSKKLAYNNCISKNSVFKKKLRSSSVIVIPFNFQLTPLKINMEPENHPEMRRKFIFKLFMTLGSVHPLVYGL